MLALGTRFQRSLPSLWPSPCTYSRSGTHGICLTEEDQSSFRDICKLLAAQPRSTAEENTNNMTGK